ncbi:MAG: MBL fold metallo-hydrolase, partial [Patescibacteria group bacterium]|nr:MBL fold metallo-hydrolase [Patescibacteria group bacterium]
MFRTFLIAIFLSCFVTSAFAQQSLSSDDFIKKLSESKVEKGHVMVFYVEQNSFALKTDQQKIIWIDPYLSRKNQDPAMFLHKEERINPEKTPADYVFCTHDHLDHTHLETVEIMNRVNPNAVFIGPKDSHPIFTKA